MKQPIRITSHLNKHLYTDAIPGHFATNHSHTNYYIDMAQLRHSTLMAQEAARTIASHYTNIQVDTILCLEGTEYISAYLARDLAKDGISSINSGHEIYLVEPANNVHGKYVFADNVLPMIRNKQVLITVGTSATGSTLSDASECVTYYGGSVCGYAALFSNIDTLHDKPVVHLFGSTELPHYHNCVNAQDCPDCLAGKPLDAIVTPHGYQKL